MEDFKRHQQQQPGRQQQQELRRRQRHSSMGLCQEYQHQQLLQEQSRSILV
jgi:hypothetical protein